MRILLQRTELLFLSFGLACLALMLQPSTGSSGVVQETRENELEVAFEVMLKRINRLSQIAYSLRVRNAELCQDARPTYGFDLHDKSSYADAYRRIAAGRGLSEKTSVRYVHPDLPAAVGGLQVGDVVLAINGQTLEGKNTKAVSRIIEFFKEESILEGPPKPLTAPLQLRIERNGQMKEITIKGIAACHDGVVLANSETVNAFATGTRIWVTSGMMKVARLDKELAWVLSHEMAHNALGHMSGKRGSSNPGITVFARESEAQADYVGLYFAARAKYDITEATGFWRRMAQKPPEATATNFLSTHGITLERLAAIEGTVEEIKEKIRNGIPLVPEMKEF